MKRCLLLALTFACAAQPRMTQAELLQRTQALVDGVAVGDKPLWDAAYADDALYFDEKGHHMDKKALLADLEPLPKGYSGSIQVQNPVAHLEDGVAIFAYDQDESESIFGQELGHARYHEIDTWLYRGGRWQITAAQVMRYYEDPAEGRGDVQRYPSFAGTYELTPGTQAVVSTRDGKLFVKRGDRPEDQLVPEAGEIFFRKGVEGRRVFRVAPDGHVDAMIDRRNNQDVIWKKVG